MDPCAKKFLKHGTAEEAYKLIRECTSHQLWNAGRKFGSFFETIFPFSKEILEEYSLCLYYSGMYKEAHRINQRLLKIPSLGEEQIKGIIRNDHYNYPRVQHYYSEYDPSLVHKIKTEQGPPVRLITFSITTCKRLDLFAKTMNSFLACCLDRRLISEWICVDDNSSEEDRMQMRSLYPFFTFVFKNEEDRGHPRSMNMIIERAKTPYLLHIEDDWEFFIPRNYITDALDVLNSDPKIHQCLFNHNYAETADDINIVGGIFRRTDNSLPHYIHDHCTTEDFIRKYGQQKNCAYWPHFSFRPSIVKTSIFTELGGYNENAGHFEMEFADRYNRAGKISAFFPGIHCIHTGRLTSERFDRSKQNAYTLNGQSQFVKAESDITRDILIDWVSPEIQDKFFQEGAEDISESTPVAAGDKNAPQVAGCESAEVLETPSVEVSGGEINKEILSRVHGLIVNMDNRQDRLKSVLEQTAGFEYLQLERFSAVNGFKLKPNPHLSRLFDGNDYNMRSGMVGCAMSHIKIMIDFLSSEKSFCLVLEDDINLTENFEEKLSVALSKLPEDFGLLYLGYHIRDQFITSRTFAGGAPPSVHLWTAVESLKQSMGGTFGYVISKRGCQGILDFIDENGMTNAIDTVQQKAASAVKIFYCEPMLVTSECYRGDKRVDSDIQYDYSSLTVPLETRIEQEKMFLSKLYGAEVVVTSDFVVADDLASREVKHPIIYDSRCCGRLEELINENRPLGFNYYILDGLVVVLLHEGITGRLYKHRGVSRLNWKVFDSWCGTCGNYYSIERCLEYK